MNDISEHVRHDRDKERIALFLASVSMLEILRKKGNLPFEDSAIIKNIIIMMKDTISSWEEELEGSDDIPLTLEKEITNK